tara:strand:+ start:159 stop:569 length:411 start_codon:yes stop_codon:yes gene_type:complete
MIPNLKGVYSILCNKENINFLDESLGGHFKGKNPTVDKNVLKNNWVDGAGILYIGKAGGAKSSSTLKRRIWQYMQFGCGKPVGHWGGRLIWQIKENKELLLAYKTLDKIEPRIYEKELIGDFIRKFGILPFANLVH